MLIAISAFIIMLSGCGTAEESTDQAATAEPATITTEEPVAPEDTTTTEEPQTPTPPATPEPFTFNPRPHTNLTSEVVTEKMWNALYNLIDATRAGEDTFECAGKKAYEWCMDETTIGAFIPPACMIIEKAGYKDGVGKIKYKMPKKKFRKRVKAYEKEIVKILNEAIRTDYSDFEKTMGLYAYMCANFQYDYTPIDGVGVEEFSDYACLKTKKGICCEIAGVYTYLLLQCGVEAIPMGGEGTAGAHDWTYVEIDGKGYHVDPTWALYGDFPDGTLTLQYFMMTEKERVKGAFEDDVRVDWLRIWKDDYDLKRFKATDKTFKPFHKDGVIFEAMDTENNIITYIDPDGNKKTLNYGDL